MDARLAGIQLKDCVLTVAGQQQTLEVVAATPQQVAALQVHRGMRGETGVGIDDFMGDPLTHYILAKA